MGAYGGLHLADSKVVRTLARKHPPQQSTGSGGSYPPGNLPKNSIRQHQRIQRHHPLAERVQDHRVEVDLGDAQVRAQHAAQHHDQAGKRGDVERGGARDGSPAALRKCISSASTAGRVTSGASRALARCSGSSRRRSGSAAGSRVVSPPACRACRSPPPPPPSVAAASGRVAMRDNKIQEPNTRPHAARC